MTNIVEMKQQVPANSIGKAELIKVLQTSLYPGAAKESVELVIGYCEAAGLDPMLKPVHLVPMWDRNSGSMRDVIMPGVGLYRIQASRTGQFAGMSEPEFGPMVTEKLGGQEVAYPEYARVTVKRALPSGVIAEFTAIEYWIENYAVKGGKEKSIAPNAMWAKRPRGQIAKCASAQALRIAFPELGAMPTADEMEGKNIDADEIDVTPIKKAEPKQIPILASEKFDSNKEVWKNLVLTGKKSSSELIAFLESKAKLTDEQKKEVSSWVFTETVKDDFVDALDRSGEYVPE